MLAFYVSLALLISAAVFVDGSRPMTTRENAYLRYENPETHQQDNMTMVRLPRDTKPVHYTLSIIPTLTEEFIFTGRVEIQIEVLESTSEVYLHSKGLNITNAKISLRNKKLPTFFVLDQTNEILKMRTENNLVVENRYLLSITFQGFLNNDMKGFYRSYYKIGNTTKWLATTHFEATYARMAFPCYDEPGFKTPFNISVARYPNQNAISNMPLKSTSKPDPAIDNRVWDNFEVTPPMPTYLVAFIVSEFGHIPGSPKKFSVWARQNAIEDTRYIMNEGPKLLKQMENFTGISYNLPKMDLAAIPDFAAAAMENWGLTTYREEYVLFNPKVCPAKNLVYLTTVVAHELSHQWFGDYVTPKWWDYAWLNEAFAEYFGYHITAEVEPTWRMDQQFVVDVTQPALFVDEAIYHHGMTTSVKTPSQIQSIFNAIIYKKGSSVMRMLEHMVSTSNYKKALNTYLRKGYKTGGSVTPDDLWAAFEKQIYDIDNWLPHGLTITSIMKGWTENQGYPLIKVSRLAKCKTVNIIIEQETYKTPRSSKVTPNQSWVVPITCTKQSKVDFHTTKPSFWSLPQKPITLADEVKRNEWILCNVQQTGYYRVKYGTENWKLLIKQLYSNHSVIHPVNRAQLIDDAYSLAIDHKLPFLIPHELLKYIHKETDPIPLSAALNNLSYLYRNFRQTSIGFMLRNYITDLIKPVYNQFGFNSKPTDDHLTKIWRSTLVSFACCVLKIEECLTAAKKEYAKNKNDLSRINPEVKGTVLCIMLNSDERQTVWNDTWTLYRTTNVVWELERISQSFACVEDTALLKTYLYKLIDQDETDIRRQNYVLESVFSTTNGIDACFEVIDELIPNFSEMSSNNIKMLEKMISRLAGSVGSNKHMNWVNKTIANLEKCDKKMYGQVISGLKRAQIQRPKVEPSEYVYFKNTEEKLSVFLESMYPSTPGTTVKTSMATNIVPTTIVLVLSFILYFFPV